MSKVTVIIPPDVEKKARALARAKGLTLEEHMSSTLAHEVLVNELLTEIHARRGKVTAKRFLQLLNKAGGEPPMPGDEIPPDLAAKLRARDKKRAAPK